MKSIYLLIRRGVIPATKITGKWVFPKRLVDKWLETSAKGSLAPEVKEQIDREDLQTEEG